jgi:hypothetical protein
LSAIDQERNVSDTLVLNCHGGLLSGHDVGPEDQLAGSMRVCVISPDRPSIGRTDRLAGHGMLPWVRSDLVPLLDHLDVGMFGVMGWSEGGHLSCPPTGHQSVGRAWQTPWLNAMGIAAALSKAEAAQRQTDSTQTVSTNRIKIRP